MKVGSLFSGGGGLDMAVEMLWPGAEAVWCAEMDRHAVEVFQRRWGVPNLGDLRAVDWTQVPEVDVLVGGYPCQPWSTAGRRKGTDDDRDGWPWFRDAVRDLGPRLVLLENVRGHAVPAGAGRTVGDLSDLGYDAVWSTVRASDVGAPHRRERWFCAAYPAGDGRPARRSGAGQRPRGGGQPAGHRVDAPDPSGDTGRVEHGDGRTPAYPEVAERRGTQLQGLAAPGGTAAEPRERASSRPLGHPLEWGEYAPAIARWEHVLGRPAPAPTDDRGRLSPTFVEFMMGWPEGHVDGIPRTAALKVLGNGVVPLQAAAAYSQLLDVQEVAA